MGQGEIEIVTAKEKVVAHGDAVQAAAERLSGYGERFRGFHGNYSQMTEIAAAPPGRSAQSGGSVRRWGSQAAE